MKKEKRSHCPINFSLESFGDKWSLLIIRDIIFKNKSYYGEFLDSEEKISTNILANRLSLLENEHIIRKAKDPANSAKYIYSLTEKGVELLPILLELIRWGAKHDSDTDAPDAFIEQLEADREGLISEIVASLEK